MRNFIFIAFYPDGRAQTMAFPASCFKDAQWVAIEVACQTGVPTSIEAACCC